LHGVAKKLFARDRLAYVQVPAWHCPGLNDESSISGYTDIEVEQFNIDVSSI
jgi:hypothetical protein